MKADLIIHNGRIYPLEHPGERPAEAAAIRCGRILALGHDAQILSFRHRDTELLDLRGATVIPGLVDGHFHLLGYAQRLASLDLSAARSIAEVTEAVARQAASLPPGEWITGGGWDRNLWPGEALPTREVLDSVAPENPVALSSKDGHSLWLNSLALRRLGIGPETSPPPGGAILKDEDGMPTGILQEKAADAVLRRLEEEGVFDAQAQRGLPQALRSLARMGLTGIHNCEGARALKLLQRLKWRGELSLRVLHHIPADDLDAAARLGLRSGFGDETLRIGGVKIFADGSLGSRTAAMLEPYLGEPDNLGILVHSEDELTEMVVRAHQAGLAVAVHAIGDRANRVVLNALERAAPRRADVPIPDRIEHVQLLHPSDLPRLARLGVVASMQPVHAPSDMPMAERHWGHERCRTAYAWRSLLESGAVLAFGSDCPVESPDPLLGVYAAVTRRRPDGSPGPEGWFPEQRLSVFEALRAYTWGNALAAGEGSLKGTLSPGKLADFVILSDDLFRIPPERILQVKVLGTFVGGLPVHLEGLELLR